MAMGAPDPGERVAVQQAFCLTVPAALHGERVDRGLALLVGVTRSRAALLVAQGRARVGGLPVSCGSRRLRSGDLLEVELAEEVASPGAAKSLAGPGEPGWTTARAVLEAQVVFVDDHIVVVDKPAGLVVHPGAGNPDGTLVQQLTARFPDIVDAGPQGDRPGIVHRLDKGTSGLLVVARSSAAREALVAQMAARSTRRQYLAVVHGEIEADEGVIEAPVGRSTSQRVKMAIVQGGRDARTRYWVQGRSSAALEATLVACRLETGRTHQVRVHFAAIGHPVVSDERYCKPSLLALAAQTLPGLHRPWLHAAELGFMHPATGEPVSFVSPLPPDLTEALEIMGIELQPGARMVERRAP